MAPYAIGQVPGPVAGEPHSFGLKWTMRLSKVAMGAVGAAPLSKAVVVPPGCSVARRSPVAWAARLAEPAREHLQFPYRRRWRSRSGPILPGIDVCRVPTRGSTDRCASAAVGLQGRKEDRVHAAVDTRRHGRHGDGGRSLLKELQSVGHSLQREFHKILCGLDGLYAKAFEGTTIRRPFPAEGIDLAQYDLECTSRQFIKGQVKKKCTEMKD